MKKRKTKKQLRGIWEQNGWYYFRRMVNGVRENTPLQTKDYEEARSLVLKILDGQSSNYKGSTSDAIGEFIRFKVSRKIFTEESAKEKKGVLMNFAKLVGEMLPVRNISEKDISRFFELKKKCAESTKDGYKTVLKSFISWCIDEKGLFMEPCRKALKGYNFITVARKEFLTMEEIQQLLHATEDEDLKYIITCGAFLGMRKKEIINSKAWWFDFEGDVPVCFIQNLSENEAKKRGLDPFRIKNNRERRVPVCSSAFDWLKEYVGSKKDYCLAPESRKKKARYRYDYKRKYMSLVNKVFPKRKINTYTLRHSFATNLALGNTAIGFIAYYLGDSVKTVEKHYAQYLPTAKSVEVLKIEFPQMQSKEAA
jgi:integrase